MQKINISQKEAFCIKCGANLLDVRNIRWLKKNILKPTFREELFQCRKCNAEFIIHYNLFDKNGHINPRAFTEDINDSSYNWQDNLSSEQKELIEKHLKNCSICCQRFDTENLNDAWFASIIHGKFNQSSRS